MTKHMVQRSITFLALTGILGCTGNPTGDLANGPDHLQATPSALYVGNGTVTAVIVTSLDDQDDQVADNFTLNPADIGPNITVELDTLYSRVRNANGVLVPDPNATRVRYTVTTTVYGESQFTVRAGSRSVTIPVRTLPVTLTGANSDLTPTNGDTVTITAPAGLSFSPTASTVVFGTVTTFLVSRSATEIRFVAQPGSAGPATVSNVSLDYAPAAGLFTVPTAEQFFVDGFPLLTASVTGLRAIGDSVTITIPAPFKWGRGTTVALASAVVSAGGALSTPVVSADSSSVRFQIGPNATDTLRITNLRINGTTLTGFQLKAQAATTTPAVTDFVATFSNATPTANDSVTLTAGSAFRFLPTATVTQADGTPFIISRSADSSQIRFVPARGTVAGPVTVGGVVFATLRSVSLTLPSSTTITPPSPRAGTGSVATAPTIALPAVGATTVIYDGGSFGGSNAVSGGVGNRFYKITVPASTSVTVNLAWTNTADIDILYGISDGSDFYNCFAGATGANPEQATCTLSAGDNIFHANLFAGSAPGVFRITLTRNN